MEDDLDEQGLEAFQRIEKELQICLASRTTPLWDHVKKLLSIFCCVGHDLILQDFDLARQENVENRLWDIHGKINGQFRKELQLSYGASVRRKTAEQRRVDRRFLEFIKSSQRFYRSFIQSLGSRFKGVQQLEALANRLTVSTLSVEEPIPATGESEKLLLLSCHQNLIRLGDLSRWRETQLETKNRNWGPAIGYYDLAGRVYPASGAPHNQLAVITLQESDHLGAVYHLYLAWAAEDSHPNAKNNLGVEFRKIEALWDRQDMTRLHKEPCSRGGSNDIVTLFLYLHANVYMGKRSWAQAELEEKAFRGLTVNLGPPLIDQKLCKMALVNIAAEYFAEQELRKNPESSKNMQSFASAQRLNIGTFSTLLQQLRSELEERLDIEADASELLKIGHEKRCLMLIFIMGTRVLPALRHYSSWLLVNSPLMMVNNDEASGVQVRILWTTYARTLTLLATTYSWKELDASALDYLLAEDEATLGFAPFKHESVHRRYFKDDGISQKPRCHESDSNVRRHILHKEMLGRIRDLLLDGIILQGREGIPIALINDGKRFAYLDGNVSVEADGHSCFSSNDTNQEETTHVYGTNPFSSAPEANSECVIDIDSERIVDDLVDPTTGGKKDAVDSAIERATQPAEEDEEDTSYGLIGSATMLEHFGNQSIPARQHSQPFLLSIEKSPFAPEPGEEQILASLQIPLYQDTPIHSEQGSQNMPPLNQQSRYISPSVPPSTCIWVSSGDSSMPTPTFQNTQPDRFSAIAGHQNPNAHKKNIQKVLDESVFRSSNNFPGSASGNTQGS